MVIFSRIKYYIFVLFALFTPQLSIAQITGKVLEIPEKFKVPSENVDDKVGDKFIQGATWEVFSDRPNNKTFAEADGGAIVTTLDFLEKCYVLAESGEYLHLVKDPNLKYDGILTSSAKDMGWVNKDNLLLWMHCLVTKTGRIDKKAMVLNTVQAIKNALQGKDSKIVRFCKDPQLKVRSEYESQLFQIFYVYKKNATSVLLGRNSRISESSYIEEDILGWVPSNRINFWDHRIALEPNWDFEAAKERQSNRLKSEIFYSRNNAEKYQTKNQINSDSIFWNADPYDKRNIGDWRRFPILSNKDGILKVGVMGEIQSANGQTMNQVDQAVIQRKYNLDREKRRNINIVFVIDGTSSMKKFYKPISTAVENSMSKLSSNYTKNSFRFGAVVYRDKLEGANLTNVYKLTNKYKDVSTFLNTVVAGDTKDNDVPEAVFWGIKTALRVIPLPQDETNIMILIGDAGNHKRNDDTQVLESELVELLASKYYNFLSYQVNNSYNVAYDDFIAQSKHLMISLAKKIQQSDVAVANSSKVTLVEPQFVTIDKTSFKLSNSDVIAMIAHTTKGKDMPINSLQKEIEAIVNYSNEYTDEILRLTDKVIMQGKDVKSTTELSTLDGNTNKFVSSYTPAVLNFLSRMNIPRDKLDLICDERYQFYMEGYTSLTVKGLKNPIYKSVLFLTRLELGGLINSFETLLNANSGDERVKMQDAWIELLKQHVGNIAREEMKNMSFEQINEKIFGLPYTSDLLKGLQLKSITEKTLLDDRSFRQLRFQIEKKHKELNRILNDDRYEWKFSSNDIKYYWISEDLLP